jgi:hypothetical protein
LSPSPTTPEGFLSGAAASVPLFAVQRHLTEFLQWRFSQLPPGSYQWRADDAHSETGQGRSEIFIGGDTPIDPIVVGQRPAVTVTRAQASSVGAGMNDRAFVDWRTGAQVKMDMVPTTLLVNVLSQNMTEAESLAWFCHQQIFAFREVIVKLMPELLYLGQRMGIGAPAPAGSLVQSSDVEWSVVVLSVPTYLQFMVATEPLNRPIFNRITMQAEADLPDPPPSRPPVLLQGTAINQPKLTRRDRRAIEQASVELPQEGGNEAESTGPLTVTIET